jgi:hypothetical protein
MRRTLVLGIMAALALAQGRQTREAFFTSGACGPGYVQADFLDALRLRLGREFGQHRADAMLKSLRAAAPDAAAMLALLNGAPDDDEIRRLLGLRHERLQFVRGALAGAVADKDKRLLFGALVRTMVEKGVDPSSEFCQLGRFRDRLTDDQFDRICRGEATGALIRDAFGLKARRDQSDLEGYLVATRASPYLLHPVGASLARRARLRGDYDPAKFPKPRDEMPGYGNQYKDGTTAGLPFDQGLPPVPYYGRNLEDFFATK